MNKKYALLTLILACMILSPLFAGISPDAAETDKSNYDVLFYHLNLHVSDSSTFIKGYTSITVQSLVPLLEHIAFDFSSLLLADSVKIQNQIATFVHAEDEIIITLPHALSSGSQTDIQIYYHGLGKKVMVSSGIYNKFVSTIGRNVTWTLSEPFSAYNWFPCKQSLTDKADSVYAYFSTDNNLKVGSNGLLTATVPLPGNRVRYEWKSKYPIAYYLISFTAGDFMDYSFYVPYNNDSILVQNYIYNSQSYFAQNKKYIDTTADLITLYSDLFGKYPFADEKYGHCTAPFGGGMEHQTMTTLVNFSFLLIAHELGHQWFGDHVTCSTWQDIWINEGFASYCEYVARQYLNSQGEADTWIKGCNDYVKSMVGGSVYVPEEFAKDEDRIFDYRLTYKKGASIIHMLRQEVGNDNLFFASLSDYLHQFKGSNATALDFKDFMEGRTGLDLDVFFNQWYFGQGYPFQEFYTEQRNDTLYITSSQSPSSVTPYFDLLIQFRIKLAEGDTMVAFRQTERLNKWQIYMPKPVTAVEADPHHWLLMDYTFLLNMPKTSDTSLEITPNPASDKIRITLENPVGDYTLYLMNAEGKLIMSRKSSSQYETVDIRSLTPGIYFVVVKNKKTMRRGKLIVNDR